jgi:hypothetical protein
VSNTRGGFHFRFLVWQNSLAGSCPPTLIPCKSRHTTNDIVLSAPTCSYVGKHPIKNVGKAIKNRLNTNACLRPYLSPTYPIVRPPTGRIRKAPPYTANELMRLEVSISPPKSMASSSSAALDGGKNTWAMISEKNPKRAKSYHSRTLCVN